MRDYTLAKWPTTKVGKNYNLCKNISYISHLKVYYT